jgi:hypothetical protein
MCAEFEVFLSYGHYHHVIIGIIIDEKHGVLHFDNIVFMYSDVNFSYSNFNGIRERLLQVDFVDRFPVDLYVTAVFLFIVVCDEIAGILFDDICQVSFEVFDESIAILTKLRHLCV